MRIPAYYFTLGLMLLSAAIVVGVIWFALALLTSMGTYIETVIP